MIEKTKENSKCGKSGTAEIGPRSGYEAQKGKQKQRKMRYVCVYVGVNVCVEAQKCRKNKGKCAYRRKSN